MRNTSQSEAVLEAQFNTVNVEMFVLYIFSGNHTDHGSTGLGQ